MDPASIVGVVGVAGQILKTIHHYAEGVSDYGDEVAGLRVELFCLKSALTQIDPNALPTTADEFCKMLDEAHFLLQTLADILQNEASRARELARRLIWPLKKQHVRDLTARLERIKTYFILVATNDTRDAARVAASTLNMLYKSVEELKTTEADKSRDSAISTWLTTFDSHTAHSAASLTRLENTNTWFLDGTLTEWASSGKGSLLWLRGKPGSGKTCIAAASVSRLRQSVPDAQTVYFYCSNNNAESQQPRTVIAWLVKQLYQQMPDIRHAARQAYAEDWEAQGGVPDSTASFSILMELAITICSDVDRDIILVVDAIDESGEHAQALVESLCNLASTCSRLRLLLTSTESVAELIDSACTGFGLQPTSVRIHPNDVKRDIDAYIETRLSKENVLSKLRPQLQADIRTALQHEHDGSFRWAQCTLDDLASLTTPKAIKQALQGITPSLSNIYMSILLAIPEEVAEVAGSMLTYLFAALRQLTLTELAEAAVFTSHTEFDEDDRMIDPEAVLRHLRSLVRYEPITQKVELAHSSVRVFLTTRDKSGEFYIDSSSANQKMCRLCLGYLLLPSFKSVCTTDSELQVRKQNWPLLAYSTYWWAHHVRAAGGNISRQVERLASAFFDSANQENGGHFAAWYQCAYPRRGSRTWTTKPLYICAREGLVDILKIVLPNISKAQLEEKGGSRGSTALHVAAAFGETEAVELLIAAGADVHERNRDGETGLQWAWFWGHDDTVEVLRQAGADTSLLADMDRKAIFVRLSKTIRDRDKVGAIDVQMGGTAPSTSATPLSIRSRVSPGGVLKTPYSNMSTQSGTNHSVSSYGSGYAAGRSARLHEVSLRERRKFLGGTTLSQEETLRREMEARDFKIPPRAVSAGRPSLASDTDQDVGLHSWGSVPVMSSLDNGHPEFGSHAMLESIGTPHYLL